MIAYRPMMLADIGGGLSLCRAAGWNQLSRDWELFLRLDPASCVVAEEEVVVGTVATLRYQDRFSWVGMVLVAPSYRGRGIGTKLMNEALRILRNEETVKLDATPAGRRVYERIGFEDDFQLSRMVSPGISEPMAAGSAARLSASCLDAIVELDREVFGADRRQILDWLLAATDLPAYWSMAGGRVQGYCLSRPGYNFAQIGPLIASDAAIARDLLSAALKDRRGKPVVLDVPQRHRGWIEWLTSIGFVEQRRFTRMYRGGNGFPGDLERQFAIAGPELG